MWLCTKLGFYSIVQKRDGFHVRARTRQDLEQLADAAKLSRDSIEQWSMADYRWRLRIANQETMRQLFLVLLKSINYDNFKSEVYSRPDQANKRSAYNRLWGALADVQESEGK